MSLIELHPDLTACSKALHRIANALERICMANGISLTDPRPPTDITPEDIAYSSDELLLKEEIQALVDSSRPGGSVVKSQPAEAEED